MNKERKLSQRGEIFAVNLFKKMSQRDAYQDAFSPGYSLASVDGNASRLANSDKVQARLKELRAAAADPTICSVKERKQILSGIVRATPADIMEISEDGKEVKVKAEALNSPAVNYIRTEEVRLGEKIKVNITRAGLTDKVRAAAELNKMEGVYEPEKRDPLEVVHTFIFELPDGTKVSPLQLRQGGEVVGGEAKEVGASTPGGEGEKE